MEYVQKVDFSASENAGADERFNQNLLALKNGSKNCEINYISTPAGGGSPAGMHTHDVDQTFYILSGTMSIEIEGTEYKCGPGSCIHFPAGVPHRNWNDGPERTIHLAINTPSPDPNKTFAKSV